MEVCWRGNKFNNNIQVLLLHFSSVGTAMLSHVPFHLCAFCCFITYPKDLRPRLLENSFCEKLHLIENGSM